MYAPERIAFPPSSPHANDRTEAPHWYRFDQRTPDLAQVLRETLSLDALTTRALTASETRPRCTKHGDGAVVILRGINSEPGADPEDMVSLRMWIDGKKVVTYQNRRVAAADELAGELREGGGASSPGEFLVALADRMTDRMQDVVDQIDGELEELEDVQAEKAVPDLREAISGLRRKVVILRRFVAPQRDALDVLVDEDFTWQTEIQERRLRESVERITRLVEQLDTMQSRASIVQDFLSVRVAERLNRTMLLLSVVAGVFLPLSFVSGLLGMNVHGIPGAASPQAFLWITGCLILAGVVELIVIWRLKLL